MTKRKLTAFQMKLEGASHSEIATATKYSEYTLRKYFAKGGRWHNDFKKWKETELPLIQKTARDILSAHAIEAMQNMVNAMNSDNPSVALRAAQDILDRAGFAKSTDGFNHSQSLDAAESAVRWFESRYKNENEKKPTNPTVN